MRISRSRTRQASGGIVVVQEIFGVTNHIKRVADQLRFAWLQSRRARRRSIDAGANVTLAYSEIEKGREYMRKLMWPKHTRRCRSRSERSARRRQRGRRRLLLGRHRRRTSPPASSTIDAGHFVLRRRVAKMLDKKPRCPIISLRRRRTRRSAVRRRADQEGCAASPRTCTPVPGTASVAIERASYSAKRRAARARALAHILERALALERAAAPTLKNAIGGNRVRFIGDGRRDDAIHCQLPAVWPTDHGRDDSHAQLAAPLPRWAPRRSMRCAAWI